MQTVDGLHLFYERLTGEFRPVGIFLFADFLVFAPV